MSQVPARIDNNKPFPRQLQLRLVESVLGETFEDEELELSIIIECTHVNLRQLAALLTIIDHFYSRMYYNGIHNYARFEKEQIQVKEFRLGSIEIVLDTLGSIDTSRIILLWLLIKYIPPALVSLSTTVSNFAKAYRDYQDGQQIRETRKAIRENLKQEKQLEKLDKNQFAQLASLLAYFYSRESKSIVQAGKCIEKSVKSVRIRKRKNKK